MADFIQALDPSKLVYVEVVLSFVASVFTAPVYNLPIFLFGMYAQENAEAAQSLRTFTFLLGASIFFDIGWLIENDPHWFAMTLIIITLLLKLPTFLSFGAALRQRGSQFAGLGFRGSDLNGPTVWSMPGGFTSLGGGGRDGYQNVDDPEDPPAVKPNHPPAPLPSQQISSVPGGYQNA